MTAITKSYRYRVYEADGSTVAWTETVNVAAVGEIGGQRVNLLQGSTAARPWTIELVDKSEAITARLSDANGRAHLLHRLADFSETTDGSTYTVLATGRIARIHMPTPGEYHFEHQDERLIERNTTIFTGSNTTKIVPQGLLNPWLVYADAGILWYQVNATDLVGVTNTEYIWLGATDADRTPPDVSADVIELLEADVVDNPKAGQGNFKTLRVNIGGTDYEVESFGRNYSVGSYGGGLAVDPMKYLRDEGRIRSFIVAGFEDSIGQARSVYFYLPGADPSSDLQLHIGGREGIDPFTLVKDIYDGEFQGGTPQTVRIEAAAFSAYDPASNPNGLIDNPRFAKMHWRIEGPENMAEWLEREIYTPLGVVPFVNAAGEIAPRIVTMPAVDQVPDPDLLPELKPSTIAPPHPSWSNEGREQVTVIKVTFEYAVAPSAVLVAAKGGGGLFGGIFGQVSGTFLPTVGKEDTGLDLFATKTRTFEFEHDRAADIRVVHEITVRGIHRPLEQARFAKAYALTMFERLGDGPIYTDAVPLSAVASVGEGGWVRINLPGSYPALQNQSRTGSRVAQVFERVLSAGDLRPVYKLLEGGPADQPLSTPSLALAASSDDPENAIEATISGLNAGENYEIHLAVGASEPDEENPGWQFQTLRGDANETIVIRGLPSGSTIWGRPRATAPGRISSDWGTADSQATTGLTAPSSVVAADVVGDQATVTWTLGEADFDVMIDVVTDPGGAEVVRPLRLPAGSTRWTLTGLPLSTDLTVRVWHVDSYGGESGKGTDDFTTTGTATTLPKPRGIRLLVGEPA